MMLLQCDVHDLMYPRREKEVVNYLLALSVYAARDYKQSPHY